jgi:phosphoribosylamine-glycine ligase
VIPETSSQVLDVITHTSCNDITYVSGARALDLGVATSLASEDADIFGPKAARK